MKYAKVVQSHEQFRSEEHTSELQSQVDGSLAYPSYRGWANFPYISLKDLANRLQEKQKVCWARRVTSLAGSPFFE